MQTINVNCYMIMEDRGDYMLNKDIAMNLLKNGEYAKIVEYFSEEYRNILEIFLTKKDIEISHEDSMIDIMYKVENNFPKYSGIIMLISSCLYNEDISMGDRIEKLIDNYNFIKNELT